MEQTVQDSLITINHWLKLGNVERAKEEAEWMIEEGPEDASGYLCLAYVYYYGLQEVEESIKYLEEALRLDHKEEMILLIALEIFAEQKNMKRVQELTEIGMKNYPENAKFHIYMGQVNIFAKKIVEALACYEKAMELDLENEKYVGSYAILLYYHFPERKEERLRAEKRALELNPENVDNLVNFAVLAKEDGNFKKARMLAEAAMKLEPNRKEVKTIYSDTIATKHKFCAFMASVTHLLHRPFLKFCKSLRFLGEKFPKTGLTFVLFVYITGWILPIYFTGWYAGSVYIALLIMYFISGGIKSKILKEVGLGSELDDAYNKRKNRINREIEILNMEIEMRRKENYTATTPKLLEEGVETQLEKFWSSGAVFEKGSMEKENVSSQQKLSEKEHKEIKEYSRIKSPGYNGWYIFIVAMLLVSIVYRSIGYYQHTKEVNKNEGPKISEEAKQAIVEYNSEELEKQMEKTDVYIIALTLASFKKSDLSEDSLRESVEEGYIANIIEKSGQPSLESLKNSRMTKIYEENSKTYVLLNSDDGSRFILEMLSNKINRIYGETWDNSEGEIQIYYELLQKLETNGVKPDVRE
ncbi:tetratricopeptide repeat protein [Bacillus manliponensis]|uniref:tetratricopeptide repeat protein n=1 Tax=Bacillus manliponensis TaxID=574376 RepID=UPI003517F3B8